MCIAYPSPTHRLRNSKTNQYILQPHVVKTVGVTGQSIKMATRKQAPKVHQNASVSQTQKHRRTSMGANLSNFTNKYILFYNTEIWLVCSQWIILNIQWHYSTVRLYRIIMLIFVIHCFIIIIKLLLHTLSPLNIGFITISEYLKVTIAVSIAVSYLKVFRGNLWQCLWCNSNWSWCRG